MKNLLIGLGNPILGDDGVGWVIAKAVANDLQSLSFNQGRDEELEIDFLSLGGLSLMERMIGYDRVILTDTLVTGKQPLGHVVSFTLNEMPDRAGGHTTAAHDTSLVKALQVGKQMGVHLPALDNIWIVGIEAQQVFDFSEELSTPIAAAIPTAVETVLKIVQTF